VSSKVLLGKRRVAHGLHSYQNRWRALVTRSRDAEKQLTDNTQKHRVHFLDGQGVEREALLENQLPSAEKLEKQKMIIATR